jgi:Lon protease-like protein
MVPASDKTVAAVGCTTKIVRKVKDYPDGRMDILTEGRDVSP